MHGHDNTSSCIVKQSTEQNFALKMKQTYQEDCSVFYSMVASVLVPGLVGLLRTYAQHMLSSILLSFPLLSHLATASALPISCVLCVRVCATNIHNKDATLVIPSTTFEIPLHAPIPPPPHLVSLCSHSIVHLHFNIPQCVLSGQPYLYGDLRCGIAIHLINMVEDIRDDARNDPTHLVIFEHSLTTHNTSKNRQNFNEREIAEIMARYWCDMLA